MNAHRAVKCFASAVLVCAAGLCSVVAVAEEKPYVEGTVWNVSLIRVKPGMFDVYMNEVLPLRKKINEEARKQGFLISSHILTGSASGKDDWDLVFLDEYKNWSAFDGLSAKYDAIAEKIVGTVEKQTQMMVKRSDVREIVGNKVMQEVTIR